MLDRESRPIMSILYLALYQLFTFSISMLSMIATTQTYNA